MKLRVACSLWEMNLTTFLEQSTRTRGVRILKQLMSVYTYLLALRLSILKECYSLAELSRFYFDLLPTMLSSSLASVCLGLNKVYTT